MDFMKVFDQTVREIKREVNLKVLKVPEIEQKVLDATDNEPWGPHGTDLAEIAKATKKFSECQLVMNVCWTRLSETGKDWRHVYKALTVVEYLVANGSERAVDEIIEHTFQISSLSAFEFVEPSGKDVGINVRKKVETIVALLNDKDKIQEVRKKATANRDKYFGLSSTGVTNMSSSTSYGSSSSSFQKRDLYDDSRDRKEGDSYRAKPKEGDRLGEEKFAKDTYAKSRRGVASENQGKTKKKGSTRHSSNDQDTFTSGASKPSTKTGDFDKYGPIHSQSPSVTLSNEEDFDDFDPRGTSTTKSAAGSSNQVDLFGDSLVGDLMDAPSVPITNNISPDVDLFADAAFVSAASSSPGTGAGSQTQAQVDLFASQPAFPPASSTKIDFFAAPDPVVQAETKSPKSEPIITNAIDPFASVPLNNFDGSDLFGAFTSPTDSVSQGPTQNHSTDGNLNNLDGHPSLLTEPPPKKDSFHVKSGVWADSLSRGLIDLNISAPKKVSLVDIGVVGGLSDGSDEREMWGPPASTYMGRAMGAGSGLGSSGFTSSTATGGNDFFSNLSSQHNAMGAGSGLGTSGFNPSAATGGNDFFSNLSGQEYKYGNFKK